MEDFKDRIANYYNLSDEELSFILKDYSYEDLLDEKSLINIKICRDFLIKSINEGKKILIYGDYDCDGIMATSIMCKLFKHFNFDNFGYYIPFREKDGYGLTIKNIDLFKSKDYEIIICVDNGITLINEFKYLKEKGMVGIIIDHHTPLDALPDTPYIIHPQLSGINLNMSAGSLCYYFLKYTYDSIDEYALVLAAISTISDQMELISYNRVLVKIGLALLNKYRYKNIIYLLDNYDENIDESTISLTIAPKINAVGRIVNDNKLFYVVKEFILNEDDKKLEAYAKWINSVNEERKKLVESAINNIDESFKDKNSVVINVDTNEGIVGIIANKYLEKYNKPCFIMTSSNENNEILKGSARSKNGFNIVSFFEENSDLFLTHGGHPCAGGFSINKTDLDKVKSKIDSYAKVNPFVEEKVQNKSILINVNEINYENYLNLRRFSPFGTGFQKPVFKIEGFKTKELTFSKNKEHIVIKVSMNSSIVYFNYDKEILDLDFVNLYGNLQLNVFKGKISTQFFVTKCEK